MAPTQILIVEDESVVALDIQSRLMRLGYAVPAIASSGEEAVRRTEKLRPALVLMDIHLGSANGLWLVKALRSGDTCPDVPVIVVTSDQMQDTVREAAGLNVQGYLLKPYQPSLLVEKVEAVLARRPARPRI